MTPQAVIFDMDGLLIDSEPLWRIAEQKAFRTVGLCLDTAQTLQTLGLCVDEVVLDTLKIRSYFQVIHSAELEPYGKPHPAVYLTTAKKLGVLPETCLAFEDLPVGVVAAKAAKMMCIAVPDPHVKKDPRFGLADAILPSLQGLKKNTKAWLTFLQ